MNTVQQEPVSITSFMTWVKDVADGYASSHTVNTHTEREVLQLLDAATKTAEWLRKRGFNCFQRGIGAINKTGFTFTAEKLGKKITFKVLGPGAPIVHKGVAETSREAYRSLDLNAACNEVVAKAIEVGETYDRDLASKMGRESGYISARRNDLDKLGRFAFNGKEMSIEYTAKKPCKVTGKRVQWWRVVEVTNGQTSLF